MMKRVATLGVLTLVLGLFGPVGTVHARPMDEPQPPVRPECISPFGPVEPTRLDVVQGKPDFKGVQPPARPEAPTRIDIAQGKPDFKGIQPPARPEESRTPVQLERA